MRRTRKKIRLILCILLCFLSVFNTSAGMILANSYTYTIYHEIIPAPDAYTWEDSISAEKLGIDSINNITDIFYRNGKIYIAMSRRIVVTDEEFNTLYEITSYDKNGVAGNISAPTCVYATEDDDIYIAEQDLGIIVQFDANGNYVRELGNPGIIGLEKIRYAPSRVVVDTVGRIYVKAKSVYEGIIELNPEGDFNRFVGANKVFPSLIERFYRTIATEEQISRMALWLPTDYSDIAFDKDGFLMATVKDANAVKPIRRLNSSGSDIMPTFDLIYPPMGDYSASGGSSSTLTTIATAEDGRFAVIDSSRSRIFVYSQEGILAYIVGGSGKTEGLLNSPVDVIFMKDKILVADLVSAAIEVYAPTEYGSLINAGLYYQSEYEYKIAASYWEQVYEINPNSVLANMGLGKYELRSENYESAMSHFKVTGERQVYSSAYEKVREDFLEKNLGTIMIVLILIIIALTILKKWIRKQNEKGAFDNNKVVHMLRKLRYVAFTWPGYVLTSPFKAFDDVKYENAGNTKFGFVILILFAWVNLIRAKYSGYIVNYVNVDKINVVLVLVSAVIPYVIFILANWAIGTLIDGKGNMSQIFKVNMYALYPTVFMYIIGTLLSRVVVYNEAAFAQFFFIAPFVMYLFYTFIGLLMVHQFTFTKGVGSVILSFVGMVIIIFIVMLLLTLVSGFVNDMFTIFDEITLYF